jgi:enoyl-CoA hydratase/carnithine racemase
MTVRAHAATSTAEAILLREDDRGVARLTLNRPDTRNSLSSELLQELQGALDALKDDASVQAVVIAANGPVFCSGHDLNELRANPERRFYEAIFAQCSRVMTSIIKLPKPVIARVQGSATAAGCQLVATCDLAVTSSEARFTTPGVHIGLFCSTPMVALSRNVGRKQAMEMLLTGDAIDAEQAAALGLVNRVVPPDGLDEAIAEFTQKITSKSPMTLAIGKEAFYRQLEMGLDEAYAYASEVMTENMLARDAAEGIDAFLEKRAPVWKGR